ncbi:MAG: hypothetical protein M3373_04920 [Gemmatimonadota bacterium]|nr:hypothetical protein [Gemmatimonadota bacterium]
MFLEFERSIAHESGVARIHETDAADKLARLDSKLVLRRFLEAAWRTREGARSAVRTILGVVVEGRHAHVVYRVRYRSRGEKRGTVAVLTLKKFRKEWRCLLNSEVLTEGEVRFSLSYESNLPPPDLETSYR